MSKHIHLNVVEQTRTCIKQTWNIPGFKRERVVMLSDNSEILSQLF